MIVTAESRWHALCLNASRHAFLILMAITPFPRRLPVTRSEVVLEGKPHYSYAAMGLVLTPAVVDLLAPLVAPSLALGVGLATSGIATLALLLSSQPQNRSPYHWLALCGFLASAIARMMAPDVGIFLGLAAVLALGAGGAFRASDEWDGLANLEPCPAPSEQVRSLPERIPVAA